MILEEGTDEQMKRSVVVAVLPQVDTVWTWGSGRQQLRVVSVDDEIVYAKFADFGLSFSYTASYWLLTMTALEGWRQA